MSFSYHSHLAIILSLPLAATIACQTSQKTFLPPAQAEAPATVTAGDKPDSQAAKPVAGAEPQSKPPVQKALEADPVADLIARIEKEYQSGQANYQAGQLEAAKQNFDSAFNQLMGSGFDLHSDERLQRELDRILEGTNNVELAAVQQGDSAAQQRAEPAPIDEMNDLNPTADAQVKAKAEAEIRSTHSGLPLVMTDQVAGFINYFSNRGRGTLERGLARSGRYEDMIRRILREEGVPLELIYLAQAESGFHPLAVSRAGARGMWQFMGSRAKGYGLERSWWVDDRQDPEKATRAAARHLHDLYNEFGDWYLAMAAYNSGPGTVQSAVKRTGYADFWELYRRNVLPKETRNYVPIILAVTIMAKNPAQYGLETVVKDKPVPYDTVKIDYPIDLRLAAECVDATAEDLLDLNPSLLRMTTPKDQTFQLRLPAGTADKFQMAVASIPAEKRAWWRFHTVQPGETLASIARTYHTNPRAIAEVNGLNEGVNNGAVRAEMRLIIPVSPSKHEDSSTYARATTRYKIRRGDTVESVAANFGVAAKMLRGWNRIKGNSLAGRKVLYLHLPVTRAAAETQVAGKRSSQPKRRAGSAVSTASVLAAPQAIPRTIVTHHKVKPGETLYSIANSYKTTVSALKKDNRDLATLRPGMVLIVRGGR
jgi:peptidoglycan lytic transglycosylase D